MKFKKSFKIALNIILHSKLRSWLTIIGIVIGIAAIISIVSLGQGAQKTVADSLNSMSADIITISPGASRAMGMGPEFRERGGGGVVSGSSGSTTKNLTTKDISLLRGVSNVKYIMGTISGNADVTYLAKSAKVQIQGVDESIWKEFTSTELASGRYLSQGDVDAIVVGSRVASSTFSDVQINRQITIEGRTFRIVGILKEAGGQEDSRIIMPIESAINVLEGKDLKNFDSISIKIEDLSLTDETITKITNALMLSHGILQNKKQDFSVTSAKAMQETISSTMSSVSLFLSAIAAISLIVGAIGIMNTMFTSVLEKTREIGILKALGAKNRDILIIFLLNAAIIGIIGGIFGIILGIVASSYISVLAGGTTTGGMGGGFGRMFSSSYVSFTLMAEVFLVSIFVGLVSGVIPAYRASRLRPVDALRYE